MESSDLKRRGAKKRRQAPGEGESKGGGRVSRAGECCVYALAAVGMVASTLWLWDRIVLALPTEMPLPLPVPPLAPGAPSGLALSAGLWGALSLARSPAQPPAACSCDRGAEGGPGAPGSAAGEASHGESPGPRAVTPAQDSQGAAQPLGGSGHAFQKHVAWEDCPLLRESLRSSLAQAGPPAPAHAMEFPPSIGYQRQPGMCWSRAEWDCFRDPSQARHPSALLLKMLHQYQRQWAACQAQESPAQVWAALKEGRRPRCKYMLWDSPQDGVGNGMLSFITAFTYALLLGRVLLINGPGDARGTSLANLFCDPFGGHQAANLSWVFPYADELRRARLHSTANYSSCSHEGMDAPLILGWDTFHNKDLSRYFCADFHAWADGASMLYGSGNQYALPSLYFVPRFRERLRLLFPRGRVFSTLAPLLLRPSNAVWGAVTRFLVTRPGGEDLALGVQFRVSWRKAERESLSISAASLAARCIAKFLQSPQLPRLRLTRAYDPEALGPSREARAGTGVRDLSSSLEEFRDQFSAGGGRGMWELPGRNSSLNGSDERPMSLAVYVATMDPLFPSRLAENLQGKVSAAAHVVRLTTDEEQKSLDVKHNEQALIDILSLAFASQVVVVSPVSTFGNIISAYAPAKSYFYRGLCDEAPAEPCFHTPPAEVKCCSGDAFKVKGHLRDVKDCVDIQHGALLDAWSES